ncbi:MAG: PEP-CTERM sorting domain-containing protein [Pirellulales bacterium]
MYVQRVGVCLSIVLLLASAAATQATVLTMDGEVSNSPNASPPPAGGNAYGPLGNGSTIVSEYGDFVAGPTQTNVPTVDFGAPPYWYNFNYGNNGEGYTPNVNVGKMVIYGAVTNTATRSWTAAGNLSKVAYPSAGNTEGGKWYWTFTADPGYLTKLISTDFVKFNTNTQTTSVNVYSGNNPMSLGSLLYTSGPIAVNNVAQTISPGVTGSALTLEFVIPSGDSLFNWAADNIVFSQSVVPEPMSLVTMLSGVAGVLMVRRRRS